MSGKRIILLSDGTGNSASKVWKSNVWRVFESLDLRGSEQVAFYDDGVGTSSFKPLAILGGVFGWGLKRNLLDIYKFLCLNYKEGDQIFAFGFSRGAFTIRVLIGLVLSQNLVTGATDAEVYGNAKMAYRAYRRERFHTILRIEALFRTIRDAVLYIFGARYDKAKNTQVKEIEFLGLWDTVAAYGLPLDEMARGVSQWIFPLELPNRKFDTRIQRACHALSLDDERTTFHPVLWNEKGVPAGVLTQVWFAGVHSNVGGGYPDDSLAYIPLYWIMTEAESRGLAFKTKPNKPDDPDPDMMVHARWRRDKDGRLYDSRNGLGGYYRYGPRKIEDLNQMKFSRREHDFVDNDTTIIHETAIQRGYCRRSPICPTRHSGLISSDERYWNPSAIGLRAIGGGNRTLRGPEVHLEPGLAAPGHLFHNCFRLHLSVSLSAGRNDRQFGRIHDAPASGVHRDTGVELVSSRCAVALDRSVRA
jgi:hypothetical protein